MSDPQKNLPLCPFCKNQYEIYIDHDGEWWAQADHLDGCPDDFWAVPASSESEARIKLDKHTSHLRVWIDKAVSDRDEELP